MNSSNMLNDIFKQVKSLKKIDASKNPQSRFESFFSKALAIILLILTIFMSWYIINSEYARGFTKARLFILVPLIISAIVLLWKGISLKWMLQWIKNYWLISLVIVLAYMGIAWIFIDLLLYDGKLSMLIAALLMLVLGVPTILYCIKAINEIKTPKILTEAGKDIKNKIPALVTHYIYLVFGIAITIGGLISLISYFEDFTPESSTTTQSLSNNNNNIETEELYGFIDTLGNFAIPCKYYDARSFHEGLAAVNINYAWGFINKKDSLVIKAQYNTVGDFHNGIAYVGNLPIYGYINKKQDTVIPFRYKKVSICCEGVVAVYDTSWKYLDTLGNMIIDATEYDDIGRFSEGMAYVLKDSKYGYINKKGDVVIEPQFDYAANFSEGIACIGYETEDEIRYGFINKYGNVVIDTKLYDKPGEFHEGKATYGYKFIDKQGESVYTDNCYVESFNEGLAKYRGYTNKERTKSGYGYLDTACNVVIPCQFNDAQRFSYNYAPVQPTSMGLWGYINRQGEWLAKPEFTEAEPFSDRLAKVRKRVPKLNN